MSARSKRKRKDRPRTRAGAKKVKLYIEIRQHGESSTLGPYRDEHARLAAAGRMWWDGENDFRRDFHDIMRMDVRRDQPPDIHPFLNKELEEVKPHPKPPKKKTIKFSELKRLEFANSKKLPQTVNIGGRRKQWTGIGWFDEGELKGDETEVIDDDQPKGDKRARRK